MKDWSLKTQLAATAAGMGIIFLMFFGLAFFAGALDANKVWPEMTVSEICNRNLEEEVNGIAIGVKVVRIYSDDRFVKICDPYFEKEYLKHKKNIEIELKRLDKAWKKMENENE